MEMNINQKLWNSLRSVQVMFFALTAYNSLKFLGTTIDALIDRYKTQSTTLSTSRSKAKPDPRTPLLG